MLTNVDAPSIRRFVDEFYRRIRGDSMLGPLFEAHVAGRWPSHLDTMVRFWSAALLHEPGYRGQPRAVHRRLPIGPEHFEHWLDLFAQTLGELFVPATAEAIHRKGRAMARGLLGGGTHEFVTPQWAPPT